MKLTIILAILVIICVGDLHAWWSRNGSRSFSSSSGSSKSGSGSFSSSSGSSEPASTDMNMKGLTNLYNSKVTKVESYSRPMSGVLGKIGIKHTGVVATTENGGRYLIHKGADYGKASSTVVTDARHMSSDWKKTGSKETSGQTISDMMKHGLVDKQYGLGALCWDSTKNIMDKAGRRKRSC